MIRQKKKILFISQNLERTGSEMVFWYLLKHINQNEIDPYLFCINKGELYAQLPEIDKSISYKGSRRWKNKIFRALLKFVNIEPIGYQLKQIQKVFKADLWYVNTLVIPHVHQIASTLGIRLATHVHEVPYAYSYTKRNQFKDVITKSAAFIACSPLAQQKLLDLGLENVLLQHSFVDEAQVQVNSNRVTQLKAEFNITPEDFVWVISGTVVFMKGLDDLLEIAKSIRGKPVKIIWLGALLDNGLTEYVLQVVKLNYKDQVFFTGAVTSDYYNYLSLANGFLMLSKEESFSMVLIEAALLGIPSISYDTGIASKLIEKESGRLIQRGNLNQLIKAMEAFMEHPYYNASLLKESAAEFVAKNQLPKFYQLLKEL